MKRGLFIVIEGIDGSGKTVQAERLTRFLKSPAMRNRLKKRDVVLTAEPTESPVGALIEKMLTHAWEVDVRTRQLLFSADRSYHLATKIMPSLKQGNIVISARYFFSTIAYGGVALSIPWLRAVSSQFPVPDIIFFIDLSPKVAMKRIKIRRNNRTLFEKERFLAKVRANYKNMFRRFPNAYTVDGDQAVEAVFSDIVNVMEKKL